MEKRNECCPEDKRCICCDCVIIDYPGCDWDYLTDTCSQGKIETGEVMKHQMRKFHDKHTENELALDMLEEKLNKLEENIHEANN